MKNTLTVGVIAALLLIFGVWWSQNFRQTDPDIVSMSGIHWHPQLMIYVKGEPVAIPPNVGIGPQHAGMPGYDASMGMAAMHTHEDMPVIHLEFARGPVRKSDIMLGQFFTMWGIDMRSLGENMRMTVNGVENAEYESYMMRDGDVIELHYD